MKTEQEIAPIFNRWCDETISLPAGYYTHDQLRTLLWLAFFTAYLMKEHE